MSNLFCRWFVKKCDYVLNHETRSSLFTQVFNDDSNNEKWKQYYFGFITRFEI